MLTDLCVEMNRMHNQNEIEMLALLLEEKLDRLSQKKILKRIAEDNNTAITFALSRILQKSR